MQVPTHTARQATALEPHTRGLRRLIRLRWRSGSGRIKAFSRPPASGRLSLLAISRPTVTGRPEVCLWPLSFKASQPPAVDASVKHLQRRGLVSVDRLWSRAMSDPKKDADRRRTEARRARRLAAVLSQPADRARLNQYADELEAKAAKSDASRQQPPENEKRKR